jgi:hypothetical protein
MGQDIVTYAAALSIGSDEWAWPQVPPSVRTLDEPTRVVRRSQPSPRPPQEQDIRNREHLILAFSKTVMIGVLPGRAATPDVLKLEKERATLIGLVNRFLVEPFGWEAGRGAIISSDTAKAAKAFFRAMDANHDLPKIAPDSEGCLTLVWERPHDPVLVMVDGWQLHMVTAAATPRAQYYENVRFDGERLPDLIAQALPAR